jgi:DNA ligase-associated metallophosphoesterase
MNIEVYGEMLTLLPERAVYWGRTNTLFVADMHLGKAATFRAHGIALPDGNTTADLRRLSQVITRTGADKLIILGDLLHAAKGRDAHTLAAFAAWRADHPALNIWLVRGNHDRAAGDPPEVWGIQVVNGPTPGPNFVLAHEPLQPSAGYALTGHLHPGVALRGKGRQMLKLPCFWFGATCAVLPAFGSFTGVAVIRPQPGDRVYVVAEGQILQV